MVVVQMSFYMDGKPWKMAKSKAGVQLLHLLEQLEKMR
jgi:hypothetical protein